MWGCLVFIIVASIMLLGGCLGCMQGLVNAAKPKPTVAEQQVQCQRAGWVWHTDVVNGKHCRKD